MTYCNVVDFEEASTPFESITSTRIALGLKDDLNRFAEAQSAKTWKQLVDDPERWMITFCGLMNDPVTTCAFNLTKVNVEQGITRAASGRGGYTDRELFKIKETPRWWSQIEWLKDDQPVDNPFEDYERSGWLAMRN